MNSFSSLSILLIDEVSRGGFDGGSDWIDNFLLKIGSNFPMDIFDDERNKVVFKFPSLVMKNLWWLEDAGNVDEPFIVRIVLRLDTLNQ